MQEYSTLVELLQERAQRYSEKTLYTFLLDGEDEEINISYAELDQRARALAAYLQETAHVGQRALLVFQPGIEFIVAFFACVYAGVIAVPVYPPLEKNEFERLLLILKNCQAKILLADSIVKMGIEFYKEQHPEIMQEKEFAQLQIIVTEEIKSDPQPWREPSLQQDSIAFLQYTSGSTGNPKGVIISHGNVLQNEVCIRQAFQHDENMKVVGWLPVYHDMGLIGNILQPLYVGGKCSFFSPMHFLQKPVRWLKAISKYKATTSGSPNFGYELCIKKVSDEELRNLDLQSWKIAYNGAEPIREKTLKRFCEKFQTANLDLKSMYPCYGLAESTLFVTGDKPEREFHSIEVDAKKLQENKVLIAQGAHDIRKLVSCGKMYSDTQVSIVDPETLETLYENEIGEIWIKGKSVARGYWNQPTLSHEVFGAYTSDSLDGPFLRSGDMGFLHDGELFVKGRIKDLIIIRGVNHYPHDIELTVEHCHPEIRPGCVAAFSVEDDLQENLIIVAEIRNEKLDESTLKSLQAIIQEAVFHAHRLNIFDICFIQARSIPKTSSGKIQRQKSKQKYEANSFKIISRLRNKIQVAQKVGASSNQGKQKALSSQKDQGSREAFQTATREVADTGTQQYSDQSQEEMNKIEQGIVELLSEMMLMSPSEIDTQEVISVYGVDSLNAIEIIDSLSEKENVELSPEVLWECKNVKSLAEYIYKEKHMH